MEQEFSIKSEPVEIIAADTENDEEFMISDIKVEVEIDEESTSISCNEEAFQNKENKLNEDDDFMEHCERDDRSEIETDDDDENSSEFSYQKGNGSSEVSRTSNTSAERSQGKQNMCEYCNRCFSKPCYLVSHLRSHTGERPFKCEQCTKSFRYSNNVTRHALITHGESPSIHKPHKSVKLLKCEYCNKCFRYSSSLARHTKAHRGYKLLKCKHCNKTFTNAADLSRHLLSRSEDDPCNEQMRDYYSKLLEI